MTLIKTTEITLPTADPDDPDDPYQLAWEAMARQPAQQAERRPIRSAMFGLLYQDYASD